MNEYIEKKIDKYLKSRTNKGNGIIKDYLIPKTSPTNKSLNLSNNDYLMLSNNEYVINQQIDDLSIRNEEVIMSSMFLDNVIYNNVEIEYANYLKKESCMFTQSGYAANTGILHALCDKETKIYIDEKTHASFWDGIYSRKSKAYVFKHNNIENLENLIIKNGPGIIIVDSLYSSYGTFCPLLNLCNLKRKYKCMLIMDESHTLGIYGKDGSGYASLLNCTNDVDFITTSLIKAFCTRSGAIFGKSKHIKFIKEKSFHNIFSSSILKNDIIRIKSMLKVIKDMNKEREILMTISDLLRKEFIKIGYNVPIVEIPSPIICIIFNDENEMKEMFNFLVSKDIYPACFVYPATPIRKPILRFTIHSNINEKDVNYLIKNIKNYKLLVHHVMNEALI